MSDDWNVNDPEAPKVFYDLGSWTIDQQADLAAELADREVAHAWQGAELVVPPFAEELADSIIAEVAAADAPVAADAPTAPVADLETKRRSKGRIAAWVGGMAAAAAIGVAIVVPTQPVVNPPVAAVVRTHAVRSSVDGVPTDKLAQSSIRAGFLK